MKINTLLEYTSPSSQPNQSGGQAPEFGRDPNVLETTTGSGSIGASATAMPGMQRRNSKGSMFQGIKTSKKFVNSPVTEDEISEEQLLTKQLRRELFKRAKDRDIGNRPEDHDIMSKDPEYDDEAGMVTTNLHTALRAIEGLDKVIGPNENLPEWVQEKIAIANDYLVTCWDYMISQHEQGRKYEVDEASSDKYFMPGGGASFGRRERDPEYHVPDPVDPNTLPYNVKVSGQVINARPLPGRQAAIQWAKEKVNAGEIDPKLTTIAPVPKMWDKRKGVAEMNVGKRKPKPDSYHINKDGKPVSLASYSDKDSAIKDRDEKHPGAEVHQVGSRGKVKGKFEEGAKVDRMVGHVKSSEMELGHSDKEAENIAWATANKRGMLNNKNKKVEEQGMAEGNGDPQIIPGMKTQYGTIVKVNGNTVTVKASNGELTTMNIHDIQQGVAEGTSLGNPVYIEGCSWDDVVDWLEKNVGPTTVENPNWMQGWFGKNWQLYPARYSDENGRIALQVSANTKLTKDRLKSEIEKACKQQGVSEGYDPVESDYGQWVDITRKESRRSGKTNGANSVEIMVYYNGGDMTNIIRNILAYVKQNRQELGREVSDETGRTVKDAIIDIRNEFPQEYKAATQPQGVAEESKGLWANIHAKRERIKHGSGERMRKPGSKGAPTKDALKKAAK